MHTMATLMTRPSREGGQAVIELALTLPLLLLVLTGIIDFGFQFQRYEVVTNAAREGARVGVLPEYGPADASDPRTELPRCGRSWWNIKSVHAARALAPNTKCASAVIGNTTITGSGPPAKDCSADNESSSNTTTRTRSWVQSWGYSAVRSAPCA